MSDWNLSRRRVLNVGGAVSVAALAGCNGQSSDSGEVSGVTDTVPAGANLLVRVDTEPLLGDGIVRDQLDSALTDLDSGFGQQPSISSLVTAVESEYGLDPAEMSELLAYVDVTQEEGGVIFTAEWSEDQIRSAIEAEKQTYSGQSLFRSEDVTVGVLPDGRYVAGSPAVTRTVIDVTEGEQESVTGDITDGFNSASEGYVQFSVTPPESFDPGTQGSFNFAPFGEVTYGYGSLYRDGETLKTDFVFEATSSEAATDIEEVMSGILEAGSAQLATDDSFPEEFGTVVESTEVGQSGSAVRVTNDNDRGYALLVPAAVLSSFVLGLGEQSDPAPTPQFDIEYTQKKLSFTKAGGDDFMASPAEIQATVTVVNAGNSTQTEAFEFGVNITQSETSDQFSAALGSDLRGNGQVRFEGVDSSEVVAGDEFAFVVDDSDATGNAEIDEWNVTIVWAPEGSDPSIIYASTS